MKNIPTMTLGAAALLCLVGGAQAYTHHPSTAAERAQTRALNEDQLKQAEQENASLGTSADAAATNQSANMAANMPPPSTSAKETQPPGSGPTSGR